MTDAQALVVVLALIYLSDCLIWLRKDAVAVVIPLRGRAFVRMPSSWAGNERGGLAFTTLLPARAVFRCEVSEKGSFRMRDIDQRVAEVLRDTRRLRVLTVVVFIALFAVAPAVGWQLGFARVGLLLIAAFLIANAIVSIAFFRAHRRVEPDDPWHRRVHAIVMLVATPSVVRAVDQVTHRALRHFDPLAVAARLAGEADPVVARMLRELAHPAGGAARHARYAAARAAGLRHRDAAPPRSGDASAYCPRCLAQYGDTRTACVDCEVALQPL